MRIYNYHPESGNYIGTGKADESPLEPGVFLVPAFATDIEPPKYNAETQYIVFVGEAWEVKDIPSPEPEPEPEPLTKAQKVAAAFAAYDRDRQQLERQLADAINYYNDAEYASAIKSDIATLDEQYITTVGGILNA